MRSLILLEIGIGTLNKSRELFGVAISHAFAVTGPITVEPGGGTGLRLRSQVMMDKATTIPRAKAATRIGQVGRGGNGRREPGFGGVLGVWVMTGQAEPDGDQDRALAPFLALLGADMAVCPTEAMRSLTPILEARLEAFAVAAGQVEGHASERYGVLS